MIKPVLVIVTMFSVIFTFSDFQLVYALTHGGPANATHLYATYAFDIGMSGGQLGMGAAVALSMLPALALLIVALTLYLSANDGGTRVVVDVRGFGGRVLRLYLPLAVCVVAMLFPFYWMLITSIKPNRELYNAKIMPLIVHQPTLKHYYDLLSDTNFLTWTYNTLLVAGVTTLVSLVLGTMTAYPLARMSFPGSAVIAIGVAATFSCRSRSCSSPCPTSSTSWTSATR